MTLTARCDFRWPGMDPGIISVCETIIAANAFCVTPLQREEILLLLRANDHGDSQVVQRLTERVQDHYTKLHADFIQAADKHMTRYKIAVDWTILMFNEYSLEPEIRNNLWWEDWFLSYGNVDQRQAAAQSMTDGDLDKLEQLKHSIELETLDELLLDRDYAVKRLRAACSNTSLSNQLLHAGDWDGLRVLLKHDEDACRALPSWIMFSARMGPGDMKELQDLIFERIKHLRTVIIDRPEVIEPPPAYGTGDSYRPPSYLEPMPARLRDRRRVDQILLRLRQTFSRIS